MFFALFRDKQYKEWKGGPMFNLGGYDAPRHWTPKFFSFIFYHIHLPQLFRNASIIVSHYIKLLLKRANKNLLHSGASSDRVSYPPQAKRTNKCRALDFFGLLLGQ